MLIQKNKAMSIESNNAYEQEIEDFIDSLYDKICELKGQFNGLPYEAKEKIDQELRKLEKRQNQSNPGHQVQDTCQAREAKPEATKSNNK